MQDYGLQDVAWALVSLIAVTLIAFAVRGRQVIRRSLAALFDTENTRRPLVRVARSVNTLPTAAPAVAHDMSTPAARTATDENGRTDARPVSAADAWLDRFEVDRTKTATIELMVYSGWSVAQIRAVIKGENAALGAEIDAARQRLGIDPEPPRAIPVRPRNDAERVLILD